MIPNSVENASKATPLRPRGWTLLSIASMGWGLFLFGIGFIGLLGFADAGDRSGVVGAALRIAAGALLLHAGVCALSGRSVIHPMLPLAVGLRAVFGIAWNLVLSPIRDGADIEIKDLSWIIVQEGVSILLMLYYRRPRVVSYLAARTNSAKDAYLELADALERSLASLRQDDSATSSLSKPLMASLFFLYLSWDSTLITILFTLAALFLHEAGHALAFRFYGYRLKAFHFFPFGLAVEAEERFRSFYEEVIIALWGPLTNVLFAVGALTLYRRTGISAFKEFASINAWLGLLNILPISPLDGGRIMRGITSSLPTIFQWGYLVFSVLLLAGTTFLLQSWVIALLVIPVLIEGRLFSFFRRLGKSGSFPDDPAEFLRNSFQNVTEKTIKEFNLKNPAQGANMAAMLFRMRYAPRARLWETAMLAGLALSCFAANFILSFLIHRTTE